MTLLHTIFVTGPIPVTKNVVRSYRTTSPLPSKLGSIFSVALSLRLPSADVICHLVPIEHESTDFPHSQGCAAIQLPRLRTYGKIQKQTMFFVFLNSGVGLLFDRIPLIYPCLPTSNHFFGLKPTLNKMKGRILCQETSSIVAIKDKDFILWEPVQFPPFFRWKINGSWDMADFEHFLRP